MTTQYKEIDIIKARDTKKKYTAVVQDTKGKKYYVDFGDSSKGHYQDRTALKHYSHMDICYTNMGQQLQKQFVEKNTHLKKYSPLYFSAKYLWACNI